MATATQRRSGAIDTLRGLLVVGVILGHFAELTDRSGFSTWLGAGFRMPVFIGLAGYLFNLERVRAMPLRRVVGRYYGRLLLPWLLALAVYLTVTRQMELLTPFHTFVRPPYHFWFVPVLMTFILVAALTRWSPLAMLGIAFPASILAMYVFGVGYATEQAHGWIPDRRFFIYPIYFYYGLWVARRPPERWKAIAACVLAPIGIAWWSSLHAAPDLRGEVAAGLLASLPLICLLPYARMMPASLPVVTSMGRNSLFFYLWHPMTFGLWSIFGVRGVPMLMATLVTLALLAKWAANVPSIARILGLVPRPIKLSADSAPTAPAPMAPAGAVAAIGPAT